MGSIENIPTPNPEKKGIPKITKKEWLEHSGGEPDDEEFKAWMEDKGIEFDDHDIAKIDLDGEIVETKKDDFGTIIEEPDAIIEKASA